MTPAPRPSRAGEEPALRAVWKTVFGDSDAFLDAFFRLVYRPGMAAVAEAEGRIVSAAYAVPLQNAVYLYAVATLPAFRGRGLGEAVTMAAAGGRPAYLCPAETSLRDWYARRMGARTVSYRPVWTAAPARRAMTPEEYNAARETLLRDVPHAVYSLPVLELFAADGGGFFETENGVCARAGGELREALPCAPGGAPFMMGLNGAPPLYWGIALD